MSRKEPIPAATKKLSITLSYDSQKDLTMMLSQIGRRVGQSSVCHEEGFKSGGYSYTVEDLSEINVLTEFNIYEEPDMIEVKPRVEIINGKICHVYASKIECNV